MDKKSSLDDIFNDEMDVLFSDEYSAYQIQGYYLKDGKAKCNLLKKIRKDFADANGIAYEPRECTNDENCMGTCSVCEAELKNLNEWIKNAAENHGKIIFPEAFEKIGSYYEYLKAIPLLEDKRSFPKKTFNIQFTSGLICRPVRQEPKIDPEKVKVAKLESLLRYKQDVARCQYSLLEIENEIEDKKQKIIEIENFLRDKEGNLNNEQIKSSTNQIRNLEKKIRYLYGTHKKEEQQLQYYLKLLVSMNKGN